MKLKTIVFILSFFIANHALAKELSITFGYQNVSSYPYELGDGEKVDEEKPGISVDMVKKVAMEMGIKPVFSRLPWKRAFLMIESGELDAIISASYNDERSALAVYPMIEGKPDSSKKLYTTKYVLFQNKSKPLGWDGHKFMTASMEIHIPLGYSVARDLKLSGAQIVEKPDISHSFMLLQKGRISGVAELEESGMNILGKSGSNLSDIEKNTVPIKEKDYYVIFSKNFFKTNDKLANEFWQKLYELRESPEMDIIKRKYAEMP